MRYFVSRQQYWGVEEKDCNIVEIASGGLDYANADMLVSKYKHLGEGQEFDDPREAVEAALKIQEQWKKDSPDKEINIAHGFTGGNTIPFEPESSENLKQWADKIYEELPKCGECGNVLGKDTYYHDYSNDDRYCSRYCAEQNYSNIIEEDIKEDK